MRVGQIINLNRDFLLEGKFLLFASKAMNDGKDHEACGQEVARRHSVFETLDLCILRRNFRTPRELRHYIKSFAYYPITNSNIVDLVSAWCGDDEDEREDVLTLYGHISFWDTRCITDMHGLFRNQPSFNENLSAWDVSQVCLYFSVALMVHG